MWTTSQRDRNIEKSNSKLKVLENSTTLTGKNKNILQRNGGFIGNIPSPGYYFRPTQKHHAGRWQYILEHINSGHWMLSPSVVRASNCIGVCKVAATNM